MLISKKRIREIIRRQYRRGFTKGSGLGQARAPSIEPFPPMGTTHLPKALMEADQILRRQQ